MWKFEKIEKELENKMPIKKDQYNNIIAAKVNSIEDYELLKLYFIYAKSTCSQFELPTINGEYEGNDWYFFEGYPADSESPCTYRLESLTYKKRQFEKFCEEFN